jgi:hypothetical protein
MVFQFEIRIMEITFEIEWEKIHPSSEEFEKISCEMSLLCAPLISIIFEKIWKIKKVKV